MIEWFTSLDPALRVYWCIALAASLFFVIQTVMTFIGLDGSDGLSADFEGDLDGDGGHQLFSIRNLVNFLLGYGWSAVSFYGAISSPVWLNLVSVAIGLSFVAAFFFLMFQITKLATDKTFKISDTLDKTADVYLSIPADMSGKGKIQVSVGGAYHEIAAMTREQRLATGSKVKVLEVIDTQTVLVGAL